MTFRVGTSGYSHAEWKGSFYPEKISQKKMLEFYSRRFPTVEVNYTFRQLPTQKVVEGWAQRVPESFRFALKAQKAITHIKKLEDAEQETDNFFDVAAKLQERKGPILFQLPPYLKKDVSRLDAFLKHIAGRGKVAFEFRHVSWFDDEVFDCLRKHSAVLCVADGDDLPQTDLVHTANWGYVRLRDDNYTDERLRDWIRRMKSHNWALDIYLVGNCLADPKYKWFVDEVNIANGYYTEPPMQTPQTQPFPSLSIPG